MKKLGLKTLLLSCLAMVGLTFCLNNNYASAQGHQTNYGTPTITSQAGEMAALNDMGVAGAKNAQTGGGSNLISIIKSFINWVLGMLGLIALVVLLRGGFQMVTAAGNEEKYKSGFTILKQAAMGLVFIGVSFFIVSMIFRLLGNVGAKNTG